MARTKWYKLLEKNYKLKKIFIKKGELKNVQNQIISANTPDSKKNNEYYVRNKKKSKPNNSANTQSIKKK